MKRFLDLLLRPALVPVWVLALAAAVLLPRLGGPGLWEPQEIRVADQALARNLREEAKARAAKTPTPPPAATPAPAGPTPVHPGVAPRPPVAPAITSESCPKVPTDHDGPGSLTERLVASAMSDGGGAGAGMRWPLALLAILCVVATAGIGLRLGGPRAGLIAGVVCLGFPILCLDGRMLIGDVGTPTAAALIVYGAVVLGRPARWPHLVADAQIAALALAGGVWLGWESGGALLGLLVPIGAVAAADGFGWAPARDPGSIRNRSSRTLVALAAAWAVLILVYVLAHQIYNLEPPTPGTREVLGHSVIPSDCWSSALGGLWKVDDNLNMSVESVFQQAAFATFPWGLVAPIAMAALAFGLCGDDRRPAGRLVLAWAGASWIATQVWQRKVGLAPWSGFPALAVGLGLWLDALLRDRAARDAGRAAGDDDDGARPAPILVAAIVFAAMVTVAVDLWAFTDKMTSVSIGGNAIKYPASAHILGLPLKLWAIGLSAAVALLLAGGLWLWRPADAPGTPAEARDRRWGPIRWLGRHGVTASLVATVGLALFWVQGWHRDLSRHLSSKHIFEVYQDLREPGDQLGVMGDLGNAPRFYADADWERIANREALMQFLSRPKRVFALAPSSELCAIHRAAEGKPYFVLDDSNPRTLLLSNKVDGARDLNPLIHAVLRTPPTGIKTRPPSPVVFDNKIELLGWTMPQRVSFGSTFKVKLYFKVRAQVGGSWKIFMHFDQGNQRFLGDHPPINGTCATAYWHPGDYIVDEVEVHAGALGLPTGPYDLRVGFFRGGNGNYTNMPITQAPPNWKDATNRVHIAVLDLD